MEADGRIAWAKVGGFSVDHGEDLAQVKAFLAGEALPPPPVVDRLDSLRGEAIATHLRLADVLLDGGAREQALAELRRALSLDPDNFIVRKQIWVLTYPERFHPVIDFAWQKQRLAAERAQEAAACGPDGCPVPTSAPSD